MKENRIKEMRKEISALESVTLKRADLSSVTVIVHPFKGDYDFKEVERLIANSENVFLYLDPDEYEKERRDDGYGGMGKALLVASVNAKEWGLIIKREHTIEDERAKRTIYSMRTLPKYGIQGRNGSKLTEDEVAEVREMLSDIDGLRQEVLIKGVILKTPNSREPIDKRAFSKIPKEAQVYLTGADKDEVEKVRKFLQRKYSVTVLKDFFNQRGAYAFDDATVLADN